MVPERCCEDHARWYSLPVISSQKEDRRRRAPPVHRRVPDGDDRGLEGGSLAPTQATPTRAFDVEESST
jgi:hypothetical protein